MVNITALRLKVLLMERGLRQREAAPVIGIAESSLSNILTGKTEASIDTLRKISKTLNCSIDWLLGKGGTDERTA